MARYTPNTNRRSMANNRRGINNRNRMSPTIRTPRPPQITGGRETTNCGIVGNPSMTGNINTPIIRCGPDASGYSWDETYADNSNYCDLYLDSIENPEDYGGEIYQPLQFMDNFCVADWSLDRNPPECNTPNGAPNVNNYPLQFWLANIAGNPDNYSAYDSVMIYKSIAILYGYPGAAPPGPNPDGETYPRVVDNPNSPCFGLVVGDVCCVEGASAEVNSGCTDPEASNYEYWISEDDGSCEYDIVGCTNPLADNYNPDATISDAASCIIGGCTDPTANNFYGNSTYDDGSCDYSLNIQYCECTSTSECNYLYPNTPRIYCCLDNITTPSDACQCQQNGDYGSTDGLTGYGMCKQTSGGNLARRERLPYEDFLKRRGGIVRKRGKWNKK